MEHDASAPILRSSNHAGLWDGLLCGARPSARQAGGQSLYLGFLSVCQWSFSLTDMHQQVQCMTVSMHPRHRGCFASLHLCWSIAASELPSGNMLSVLLTVYHILNASPQIQVHQLLKEHLKCPSGHQQCRSVHSHCAARYWSRQGQPPSSQPL